MSSDRFLAFDASTFEIWGMFERRCTIPGRIETGDLIRRDPALIENTNYHDVVDRQSVQSACGFRYRDLGLKNCWEEKTLPLPCEPRAPHTGSGDHQRLRPDRNTTFTTCHQIERITTTIS